MIIDKALQLSDNQVVTSTANSTNVIDFGQANPNVGMDGITSLVFTVDDTIESSSSATSVTFSLADSADNRTFDKIVSVSRTKDELNASKQVVIRMPVEVRRYVRVEYGVASGPLTGGSFSAQIVAGIQNNTPQPDSANI